MTLNINQAQPLAKRLGKALHKLLWSKPGLEIMNKIGGTWTQGGCWVLGQALKRWSKSGGLWEVIDAQHNGQHITFFRDNLYLDGDGACTRRTMLKKWSHELFCKAKLKPLSKLDEEDWYSSRTRSELTSVRQLTRLLFKNLPEDLR